MSQPDDALRIRHMLSHAREAVEICSGRTRADLDRDRLLNLALVRLIEIIGEAANRVTPAGREEISSVPWPLVVGMRNRLVHGYDAVDFDLLWETVQQDLPSLIAALEAAGPR